MKKMILNKKGFTLVELLVVVAIIAILSTIGLTLFNGAQQSARDARRRNDVDAIAAALEAKKAAGVSYYSAITNTDFSGGQVPLDTTTAQYCIKVYTNQDAAKTDAAASPIVPTVVSGTVTGWDANASGAGSGSGICPTGFWKADTSNAFSTAASKAFTDGSAVALTTIRAWRVCAKLENSSSAAGPGYAAGTYCKNSAL